MALHLKLKPRILTNLRLSFSSSSSTPPPPDSTAAGDEAEAEVVVSSSAPPSPAPSPFSYFRDIKDRLKSPPSPPRRIPDNPPPPPFAGGYSPSPVPSFEEVRKHLAEFRQRSQSSTPLSGDRSPPQTLSFQDLFKKSVANRGSNEPERSENLSFDSIRESLKQLRKTQEGGSHPQSQSQSPFNANAFSQNLRSKISDQQVSNAPPILGPRDQLPDPIFWKELREKNKGEGEDAKGLKTEFLIPYTYEELGEKLRRLRPDKGGFSLSELNERLAKLRQLEEENESRLGGVPFNALRESLLNLKEKDAHQKVNLQKLSILTTLGGQVTEAFMLKPPQEQLLEKYLHPDHMSSEEKMKLELKKVRDEFKMSESDCGSTRVQVAQLTTKIKYLSKALHKKDKHSRKGLLEMVQRRKKLLKYLRRTDWDSYCLVLSKLGLRDVPEYKVPDYKA